MMEKLAILTGDAMWQDLTLLLKGFKIPFLSQKNSYYQMLKQEQK